MLGLAHGRIPANSPAARGRIPVNSPAAWGRRCRLQVAGRVSVHDIHSRQVGRQVRQRCSGAIAVQLSNAHTRLLAHPAGVRGPAFRSHHRHGESAAICAHWHAPRPRQASRSAERPQPAAAAASASTPAGAPLNGGCIFIHKHSHRLGAVCPRRRSNLPRHSRGDAALGTRPQDHADQARAWCRRRGGAAGRRLVSAGGHAIAEVRHLERAHTRPNSASGISPAAAAASASSAFVTPHTLTTGCCGASGRSALAAAAAASERPAALLRARRDSVANDAASRFCGLQRHGRGVGTELGRRARPGQPPVALCLFWNDVSPAANKAAGSRWRSGAPQRLGDSPAAAAGRCLLLGRRHWEHG